MNHYANKLESAPHKPGAVPRPTLRNGFKDRRGLDGQIVFPNGRDSYVPSSTSDEFSWQQERLRELRRGIAPEPLVNRKITMFAWPEYQLGYQFRDILRNRPESTMQPVESHQKGAR